MPENFPTAKLIVFISRHSSQSGKPTLSVHAPGNFGDAELGGLPKTLSVSPALAMQNALKALMHYKEKLNLNYEVSFECTHHGPSLNVPTMFVELGSSAEQWSDLKAAEAVAHSAMYAIANFTAPTSLCSSRYRRNTLQPKVHAYGFGWRSSFWTHDSQVCCPSC